MSVEVSEVRTGRDRRAFTYLPEKLYFTKFPCWVHPLYRSEKAVFDPARNDAWSFCDGKCFLARRQDEVAGRIMGIVNHRVNELGGKRWARFGFFDCVDDRKVAAVLFHAVEDWARSKGCTRIVGPLGFTDLDAEGMLVEGFGEQPSMGTWWHPAYAHRLVQGAGYVKQIDWHCYLLDVDDVLPGVYARIAARVRLRSGYRLVEFTSSHRIKPFIEPLFVLANQAHRHLFEFSPLSETQIRRAAASYLKILDPRFVKMVTSREKLVGFSVGIPDPTAGIRAARGRLYPFGFLKILSARRRSDRLDLITGAVDEAHRGRGIDVLMAQAMFSSAQKAGIKYIDSHLILENNRQMRAEMERLGGRIYKRYRAFGKEL